MTDLGITKITIKKGQGITHALRDLVKEKNMVMSDGSISKAEWNNTMDKLAELQAKRSAEGKASIFTGGTNKTDYRTSFVVHPNQQIDFTEEEINELYKAMGVSLAEAEAPAEPSKSEAPQAPAVPEEPTAPADSTTGGSTNITVGNGNGTTVIIDGDGNAVSIGKADDKPAKPEEPDTGAGDAKTDVKVGDGNGTTVIIIGDDNTVVIGKSDKVEDPDAAKDPDKAKDSDGVKDSDADKKADDDKNADKADDTADKNKTIIDTLKDVIFKLLGLIKADDVEPVKPKDTVEPKDKVEPKDTVEPKKPTEPVKPQQPETPKKPEDTDKLTNTTIIQKLIEIIKQLLELIQAEPAQKTDNGTKKQDTQIGETEQGTKKSVYLNLQPGQCLDYDKTTGKFEKKTFKNHEEELLWRYQNISGLTKEQSDKVKSLKSVEEIRKYLASQGIEVKKVY